MTTYEYKYVQQITRHKRDEHGNVIEAIFLEDEALRIINEQGAKGWRFVHLIPDENGRTLMEFARDEPDPMAKSLESLVKLFTDFSEYEKKQSNKKWWQWK